MNMKLWAGTLGVAFALALTAQAEASRALVTGTGASSLADAKAAGTEAAKLARAALGGESPKLVVVFAARKQLTPELVSGVAEVFEKALISGCEGYAPLTAAGNFADQGHEIKSGVTVLALGGKAEVKLVADVVRKEDGKDGFAACGQRIGDQLKAAVAAASGSKLIFTFGNQHVGSNQPFVEGLLKALGGNVPVVGAAAGGGSAKEIVKGELVTVAVLISGNFKLGLGLCGGNGDLVAKADESLTKSVKAQPGKPALVLVFDCGGRRGELFKQKKLADEFAKILSIAQEVPLFGFNGGGEIGTASASEPAKGVGFSVASAALFVE
ncbi:MAG: FIST C-terminal domain-containing protein [Kiritimatiellaeota bacterium]|nr:FIST C-terminal domain-containing protein [Kiritimatiellota bacterium]